MVIIRYTRYEINDVYSINFYHLNVKTRVFNNKWILKNKYTGVRHILNNIDESLLFSASRKISEKIVTSTGKKLELLTVPNTVCRYAYKRLMNRIMSIEKRKNKRLRRDRNGIRVLG